MGAGIAPPAEREAKQNEKNCKLGVDKFRNLRYYITRRRGKRFGFRKLTLVVARRGA